MIPSDAPLFDALKNFVERDQAPFYSPGHKGGRTLDPWFRGHLAELDLNNLPDTDTYSNYAITVTTTLQSLAFITGPSVAGVLIATAGVAATYGANIALLAVSVVAIGVLSGCASVSLEQNVNRVNTETTGFTDGQLSLAQSNQEREQRAQLAAQLLAKPLGQKEAVQLALTNSHALQALLAQGWAESADAAQVGLAKIDGAIGPATASADIIHAYGHGHIGLGCSARTGRIVGPVKVGQLYYVAVVRSARAAQVPPYAQVAAQARQQLLSQRVQQAQIAFQAKLTKTWRPKTACAKGYIVPECGNAAAATTTTTATTS